jgi:site-specific recombinase XerD
MTTLSNVLTRFLLAKGSRSPRTVTYYKSALSNLHAFVGDEWPIDPAKINAYYSDCKRRGLKKTSIASMAQAVVGFLNWAIRQGELDANLVLKIEKHKHPRGLPRGIKEEQLKRFFAYLARPPRGWRGLRDKAAFVLLFDTAMRIDELSNLTRDRVDLEEGSILLTQTKTDLDRVVYFSEKTGDLLAAWLACREEMGAKTDYIFVSNHRGRWRKISNAQFRDALKRLQKKAGCQAFSPHRIRHTAALNFLRRGMPLTDLMQLLGHCNLGTTAIYLRSFNPGLKRQQQEFSIVGAEL